MTWACGGGGDDNGSGDGGNVSDACDDGDIPGVAGEISEDVPDDFPDDLPIYDGADFRCGYQAETDDASGVAGIWTTGDSLEEVTSFYDDEFSGDGPWVSQGSGSAGGSSFWTVTHDDDAEGGVVTLTSEGDNTAITVVVSDDLSDLPSGDDDDSASGNDDDSSRDDGDSSGDDGDGATSDPDDSDTGDDPGSGDAELPPAVDLPDDFPSDVPLPDAIVITNASSFSGGGANTYIVEFHSQDSIDELSNHFKSAFEGQSWSQALHTESNGQVFDTYAENDDGTGSAVTVTIYESDVPGYNIVALTATSQ
jgi:hypothetical protein